MIIYMAQHANNRDLPPYGPVLLIFPIHLGFSTHVVGMMSNIYDSWRLLKHSYAHCQLQNCKIKPASNGWWLNNGLIYLFITGFSNETQHITLGCCGCLCFPTLFYFLNETITHITYSESSGAWTTWRLIVCVAGKFAVFSLTVCLNLFFFSVFFFLTLLLLHLSLYLTLIRRCTRTSCR